MTPLLPRYQLHIHAVYAVVTNEALKAKSCWQNR